MYEALLYDGELKLNMTYRTGGTDATYRLLLDLLEQQNITISNEVTNILLYLSSTVTMQFIRVSESPQLDAIEAFWQFFEEEVRIVSEPLPGIVVYSVVDDAEKLKILYDLILYTLPQKFVTEMWRVAWFNAQKTLYPAPSEAKPEVQLTDEQRADTFLESAEPTGANAGEDA